jgi:hypothetical protein
MVRLGQKRSTSMNFFGISHFRALRIKLWNKGAIKVKTYDISPIVDIPLAGHSQFIVSYVCTLSPHRRLYWRHYSVIASVMRSHKSPKPAFIYFIHTPHYERCGLFRKREIYSLYYSNHNQEVLFVTCLFFKTLNSLPIHYNDLTIQLNRSAKVF